MDAELLLVAGLEAEPDDVLGVWLQWKSAHVPADVTTAWTQGGDLPPEMEDDPSYGRVPTADPAWGEALAVLAGDGEFQRRRDLIGDRGLHVVVGDVDEWLLTPWPSEDDVEHVVLTVPAAAAVAAESRTEFYLDAVVTLVTSTQQQLGLDD
ncbi:MULTISPECIES: hypothetical protein [unclassified Nocardioides]|uniref:hypothetical protein n=1 Tax=unclassified Nocardioides TaxID=2615069 RepID=UPI0009F0670C|nr:MULTISPECIES: hypothetical protein [unclassified Nocardioides]GAW50519.1 hypothetical protein PD653B2_2854 [Nocardioides sp. PD653-B2]GAW56643.1 hypothetical protein PD653_4080 [Nocardioides sp. PD653]